MKKIGFVDYYLSEWHANNYPVWFKAVNEEMGTDYEVAYAWAELDVSPIDGVTSAQWCEKFGAQLCSSLEELCEKSDYIIVLAPSDPEKHLPFARTVLKYGKPTFIDKTFAPNSAEANEMFELGEKYGTKFFSTSALRCATELEKFEGVTNLMVTGGGSNLPEYSVHIIEIAVSLLQDPVKRVMMEAKSQMRFCHAETVSGKTATLCYMPGFGYSVAGELADGKGRHKMITSPFFNILMGKIITFFETNGEYPFDPAETREVMRVRDAVLKAEAAHGTWIEV
ncbi:MAG: Gfo/Idh/MocA family oxidoreductase [Clostridia bacterium]|nr:Gfo/Idh/MocA family oxidoreductase [Clostridia bacterium]